MYTLPPEIIKLIWSYDSYWNSIFDTVIQELNKNVTIFKLNNGKMIFHNKNWKTTKTHIRKLSRQNKSSFYNHLFYPTQLKEMFRDLSYCKCCSKHMRNCPQHCTDIWDEDPILYMDDDATYCNCPCRHYKRIIVNAIINDNL